MEEAPARTRVRALSVLFCCFVCWVESASKAGFCACRRRRCQRDGTRATSTRELVVSPARLSPHGGGELLVRMFLFTASFIWGDRGRGGGGGGVSEHASHFCEFRNAPRTDDVLSLATHVLMPSDAFGSMKLECEVRCVFAALDGAR